MSNLNEENKTPEKVWYGFLDTVMKIPGAKVDRRSFLAKEFSLYCNNKELEVILEEGPRKAGIDPELQDKIANGVIAYHGTLVTATSFLTGLPGGLAMIGTIPADLIQYNCHALQVAQKLAYVYGYPDLTKGANDFFLAKVTVLIGVMYGAAGAAQGIKVLSQMLAKTAAKRLPAMALTKTAIYPLVKQIARWFGVNMTKQTFAKGVAKAIPLLGGLVSGGLTAAIYFPQANSLKQALRLEFAR